ncbi:MULTISPECIES: nickel-dependent lactate racemase [unclassified Paenibacillus]|uniref:nickel-dependent lactate racemase n=1 Tax=unclassified Paenibacillus TaxID=185978 RepID=UPI00114477C4|nr:nickel-dependent lactate racemase [Paenibacillus sp. tmac-D7]
MIYQIPYGKGLLHFELEVPVAELAVKSLAQVLDEREEVRKAVRSPIGSERLADLAAGKKNAVIVINDITRPTPTKLLVEEITKELNEGGIPDTSITLLVATGNHRPNTNEELQEMVGYENFQRFLIVNHNASDPSQLVYLGQTRRGLDIEVNRLVVEADLTIITGIITPHQTAGFSGGRKSIVPGVAGVTSLLQHHSFPIRSEEPVMGITENNRFHEEAVEAARTVGVDFIVNVVKNHRGEIVATVAGDLEEAHEAGVTICRQAWELEVPHLYDITIVSPGGYPKDFDMHQSQKALASAEIITKPGGSIILVAECPDGIGSFGKLLIESRDPQEVIDRFKQSGFDNHNHSSKAYMYARALLKHNVYFISHHLDPSQLKTMFFYPSKSIEQAFQSAKMKCSAPPTVAVLPYAVDCLLKVRQ